MQIELTGVHLLVAREDDRRSGGGYLWCRELVAPAIARRCDEILLSYANPRGWSYEDLFRYVNSYQSRLLADHLFTAPGDSRQQFQQAVGWGWVSLPELVPTHAWTPD